MKPKHLFLILLLAIQAMATGMHAAVSTDDIDYSSLSLTDDNGYAEDFSGVSVVSPAVYAGALEVSGGELFFNNGEGVLATTNTGGYVKSVTVYWSSSAVSGDDALTIWARDTKYDGDEVDGAGTEMETLAYDGSSSQTYNFAKNYSHILLMSGYEAHVEHIEIEWTLRSDYAITTVAAHGTITGATSAYSGDVVTMSMKRSGAYYMTGYMVYKTGDPSTKVKDVSIAPETAAQTITFTMPSYAVTVEGKFVAAPTESLSATIVDGSSNNFTDLDGMTSGTTLTYAYSVQSDYTGEVSASSTNTACATVELSKTNAYSGNLIIHVYQTGDVKISLSFTADLKYKKRTYNSKTATVARRPVALVTSYTNAEGLTKYFATTNDLSGVKFEPLELMYDDGNYYYKSGSYGESDIEWYIETIYNKYGNRYRIYSGATGATQIYADGVDFYLATDERLWKKDGSNFYGYTDNRGVVYNNTTGLFESQPYDNYLSLTNYAASVVEVPIDNVSVGSEYTRSLTSGNYATMCLPYAVSRSDAFFSGVDVFNITGKYMTGETVTGIEIEEETGTLEAGKPYVIQASASSMSAWHGIATCFEEKGYATGLVGNLLAAPLSVPTGCYGFSKNKLRMVNGGTATIAQFRAYIDLEAVPEAGAVSAPGRRVIYSYESQDQTQEPEVTTSLEDFLNNGSEINWNEPVYNMLGQRVGRGTTGVLIQNGQKYLIQ